MQVMNHMFSSHKSRSHGDPNRILFLSILPFSSSQSKHGIQKRDALQQFLVGAGAVGKCFLLRSHSIETLTAEVSMSSSWLNKCPRGYFHPLMVSSLSLLIHSQLLSGWSQGISEEWLSAIPGLPRSRRLSLFCSPVSIAVASTWASGWPGLQKRQSDQSPFDYPTLWFFLLWVMWGGLVIVISKSPVTFTVPGDNETCVSDNHLLNDGMMQSGGILKIVWWIGSAVIQKERLEAKNILALYPTMYLNIFSIMHD